MDQVVRELITEHLAMNPGCHASDAWPEIAVRASRRMREIVTEPFVAGIFWDMHHEGLVEYSVRGTMCLSRMS